jgi:dihydrofolate reductase
MRKLKLQVQVSVDGFVAGPGGEMDWMVWDWDDELKSYVSQLTASIDTILLGRKMAGGFITHWTSVAGNPNDPEYAAGKVYMDTPKVVFSKTLSRSEWKNTVIAPGDLTTEINRLKSQAGKDMIVYGGASMVSALNQAGLIDEFHLFVNPAVLGSGLTIFKDINQRFNLRLMISKSFDCGIVLLHYVPA